MLHMRNQPWPNQEHRCSNALDCVSCHNLFRPSDLFHRHAIPGQQCVGPKLGLRHPTLEGTVLFALSGRPWSDAQNAIMMVTVGQ